MKRRLHRLFRENGKIFILAMDHGGSLNVLPELKDTGKTIKECVDGGVDAFLTTFGIATTYKEEIGRAGIILRLDGATSQLGPENGTTRQIFSVEDAVKIGADGIVCMGFPGSASEETSLTSLSKFVSDAYTWGMPLVAEMLPKGFDTGAWTPENIAFACRLGAEYGADIIKTQYTGDKESFRKVVEGCYKPVVILGGPGDASERELLTMIKDSLEAGGRGVAIGRSIWKHPAPGKYCRAIAKIIHEGASVEEALRELA
jgi:DhnA family fructose-bisphosphate aldolase class Ia